MNTTMDKLAELKPDELAPFSIGQPVEATVISTSKHRVLVDVADVALGMIPEKEFSYDTDDLQPGDKVVGQVLLNENREGYVILSLKRADKERVWKTLNEKKESSEPVKVKVTSANRGGLIVEFGGIEGFIPVSQLSSSNYSNNVANQQSKIIQNLRALIDKTIIVKIISADRANSKLIFSEKKAGDQETEIAVKTVDVGTKLQGNITGIVDFGLFVKLNIPNEKKNIEGLVHISEVSWDRIENLSDLFKINQTVDVIVIDNSGGRLSLSIKRLSPDPWESAVKKFKKNDKVQGEVTRVTPFGAFVKIENTIDGLVHISQLGEKVEDPSQVVQEGNTYEFIISDIDLKGKKISLSYKSKKEKKVKDKKFAETESAEKKEKKTVKSPKKSAKKPAKK